MSTKPRVSVVVPTFRRPALIARCVTALLVQTLRDDDYEILVADDAGEPTLAARLAALPNPHGVRLDLVTVGPAHGPAAARNAGWRAAQGEIVAFTDDDTIPAPDWLAAGLAAMREADAATGRVTMALPTPCTDYARDAAGLTRAEFVTANCFVRRAMLEQIDGFDERYTEAWREDSDLHFALLARGARLIRASAAVVDHPLRPAGFGVSLRQQRKIRFDALLYRKYPRLYRERIRARPQWRYYAIVLAAAVALAGAVSGRWSVAAIAAAIWGALTLAFCLRRLRGTTRAPAHLAEMLLTSIAIPPLAVYWRAIGAWRFRSPLL
ncbi:MAG TPA: glycosyltransferase family A protein [Gammaproteobacteria bacterium]|nr:glycosyltransferase family A protein [Gammaproteobacteria bacterium]